MIVLGHTLGHWLGHVLWEASGDGVAMVQVAARTQATPRRRMLAPPRRIAGARWGDCLGHCRWPSAAPAGRRAKRPHLHLQSYAERGDVNAPVRCSLRRRGSHGDGEVCLAPMALRGSANLSRRRGLGEIPGLCLEQKWFTVQVTKDEATTTNERMWTNCGVRRCFLHS